MKLSFFYDFFRFFGSILTLISVFFKKLTRFSLRRVAAGAADYDPETGISISQLTAKSQFLPPLSEKLPDPPAMMKFDGFMYDSRSGVIQLLARTDDEGKILKTDVKKKL